MDDHLDARAGQIAEHQLGLITGSQADGIGFTRHQIDTRVTTRRWTRVARDVFAVTGSPPGWRRDLLAACLAGPAGTVASHASAAAALWGLGRPSPLPHVTVPRTAGARLRIAKVHRADLSDQDLTRIGELPVTGSPGRSSISARSGRLEPMEAAVDTALDGELVTPAQLEAAIERAPRGGASAGRPVAVRRTGGVDRVRSSRRARPRPGSCGASTSGGCPNRCSSTSSGTSTAASWPGWTSHGRSTGSHWSTTASAPIARAGSSTTNAETAAVEALGWAVVHADRIDLRPGQAAAAHPTRRAAPATSGLMRVHLFRSDRNRCTAGRPTWGVTGGIWLKRARQPYTSAHN